MTNKQTKRHLFTILLMIMLGTFTSAPLVRAQKPDETKAPSPSGPQEGIKVHGEWTIEIRNPDGKLVERREFKNALTLAGSVSLGKLLRRESRAGEWVINLTGLNPACLQDNGDPIGCVIYELTSQLPGGSERYVFKTLTISGTSGLPHHTALQGTATAQRNGVISTVQTNLQMCPWVDNCTGTNYNFFNGFASTSLATPINVVAGQIIQVTVVISFS